MLSFWNRPTALFCEASITGPPEIANSVTALFIFATGLYGSLFSAKYHSHEVIRYLYILLATNGIGSYGFHSSGQYGWAKFDIWSMFLFAMLMVPTTFDIILYHVFHPNPDLAFIKDHLPPQLSSDEGLDASADNSNESILSKHGDVSVDIDNFDSPIIGAPKKIGLKRETPMLTIQTATPVSARIHFGTPIYDQIMKTPVTPEVAIEYIETVLIKFDKWYNVIGSLIRLFFCCASIGIIVWDATTPLLDENMIIIGNNEFNALMIMFCLILVYVSMNVSVYTTHKQFLADNAQGNLVKSYIQASTAIIIFSASLWILEMKMCHTKPEIWSKIPFHAVWHVLSSYSIYLMLQALVFYDSKRFGLDASIQTYADCQNEEGKDHLIPSQIKQKLGFLTCTVQWNRPSQ